MSVMPVMAARISCNDWNTGKFFKRADVTDISRCLKAGANANVRNKYGQTPLHRAAAHSKIPTVVTALVKAGANVNARDTDGWTPLHIAARENQTFTVVKTLLRAGARPNARDKKGNTPLYLSVRNNKSPATLTTLLRAGADPNARNQQGQAPLHFAAGIARAEAINLAHTIAMILGMKAELAALEKSESLTAAKRKAKLAEAAYKKTAEANTGDHLACYDCFVGGWSQSQLAGQIRKNSPALRGGAQQNTDGRNGVIESRCQAGIERQSRQNALGLRETKPALKGTGVYWRLNEGRSSNKIGRIQRVPEDYRRKSYALLNRY